jgi:CBS domain-containing protein
MLMKFNERSPNMAKVVRDLMHPGILTCKPDAPLGQVAVLLNQHHVHALIVADRDGRALGIISDFDLLAGEWLSSDSESLATMRSLTASDLMSHPVDSVESNIPLSEAVNQLIDKEISRLLVTEGGKLF